MSYHFPPKQKLTSKQQNVVFISFQDVFSQKFNSEFNSVFLDFFRYYFLKNFENTKASTSDLFDLFKYSIQDANNIDLFLDNLNYYGQAIISSYEYFLLKNFTQFRNTQIKIKDF